MKIKIEASARHIHLTREDIDILFGKDYQLKKLRSLSQSGEFAAEETVSLQTEKEEFKLRVIGPARTYSQIELSLTDAIRLGINPPLRLSGDLEGVELFDISGPNGTARAPIIIAKRHLHLSAQEADKLGISQGQEISVKIEGERGLVLKNVISRVDKNYSAACHIDTDEANACGLWQNLGEGEIIL